MKQDSLELERSLEELKEILHRCVKCGRCRAVCPVFTALGSEPAAARGKLALLEAWLRAGRRLRGRRLQEVLSLCLLCGRCTANCPNGAGAKEAVALARSIMAAQGGLAWTKTLLSCFSSLHREARDPWLKAAGFFQRLVMKELPMERGLVLRLSATELGELWAPKIKPPFFLETHAQKLGKGPRSVALFAGCTIHYLAPEVGEATLGVLDRMGFEILIPGGQGCCGLMAMGMGDKPRAARLARKVVEDFAMEEIEAVVVPCASCALQLSRGIPQILNDDPMGPRARLLAAKVKELSVFLLEQQALSLLPGNQGPSRTGTVAYHDPCHLALGMGIREEPRKILKGLGSRSFRELDNPDECCGMGGTFRVFHPDAAASISWRKLQSLRKAKVNEVVTGCMGCWMGLKEMLHRDPEQIRVRHLGELVWEELEREHRAGAQQGG